MLEVSSCVRAECDDSGNVYQTVFNVAFNCGWVCVSIRMHSYIGLDWNYVKVFGIFDIGSYTIVVWIEKKWSNEQKIPSKKIWRVIFLWRRWGGGVSILGANPKGGVYSKGAFARAITLSSFIRLDTRKEKQNFLMFPRNFRSIESSCLFNLCSSSH